MNYTPGPWKFPEWSPSPEGVNFTVVPPESDPDRIGWESKTIPICNSFNEILAEVKVYNTKCFLRDFNQFEANAYLISASPDLLEALEGACNFIEVFSAKHKGYLGKDWEDAMSAGVKEMKSAIEKAKGL